MGWLSRMFGFSRVPTREEQRRFAERTKQLCALSLVEAQRRVLRVLADPRRFTVTRAASQLQDLSVKLGPIVADFYRQFETVHAVYGDMRLYRSDIGASVCCPQLVRIGLDVEHTELVVEPGTDALYVVDGTEDDWREDSYPSVWHYILIINEILYGEREGF